MTNGSFPKTFELSTDIAPTHDMRLTSAQTLRSFGVMHLRSPGFTLVEVLVAIAVVAILGTMASASYNTYREKMRVDQAIRDIAHIQPAIAQYVLENRQVPPSLAVVGMAGMKDPWGNPYIYTDLSEKGAKGDARKDHKLNPINSDYDLFSSGKNGTYRTQISQKESLDDIIRARDGAFIGVAADFSQ